MNKNNKLLLITLIIILAIPLIDLLHPGLPLTHDGKDHLARIANFYQNLKEGIVIPRWAEYLNWGYGHPILMFLYPLSSYGVSLLYTFGFSLVNSLKIFFAISFILSGITMYLFVKELINKESAFVSALLYTVAPYRFIDLYVRGALGEHTAFIFPPLIGYFLLKLKKNYSFKYLLGLSLSTAGLILSHNAISLMFFPLALLFTISLSQSHKIKKKYISIVFLSFVAGFGIAAFFWVPALLEGKYTLRSIVIGKEYQNSFVSLKSLIFGPWSYGGTGKFTTQLGPVQWLSILAGIILLFKSKFKSEKLFLLSCLTVFFISLFIMTSYSGFLWEHISLLPKFQFPWRFLTLSIFTSSIIGGLVLKNLSKNKTISIAIIAVCLIFSNASYWKAQSYINYTDNYFFKNYSGTTDTGESAPIWSVRFMEKGFKSPLEVLDGNAQIQEVQRISTHHIYAVDAQKYTRLMENTLYFPGWRVIVDNHEVPILFQERNHHGLMLFDVTKGLHRVDSIFTDTKIRVISNIISILSMILIILLAILERGKLWKRYLSY